MRQRHLAGRSDSTAPMTGHVYLAATVAVPPAAVVLFDRVLFGRRDLGLRLECARSGFINARPIYPSNNITRGATRRFNFFEPVAMYDGSISPERFWLACKRVI